MDKKESNLILIIDFGSQYTQLIARRVRESGVYSLVKSNQITEKEFKNLSPIGIILSGGPNSVNSKTKYKLSNFIFNSGVPILGICYGMQLIADFFGGKVMPSVKKEFGNATFRTTCKTTLFKNIKNKNEFNVWMSHSDKVIKNPSGFKTIGCSKILKMQLFIMQKRISIVYNFILRSLIQTMVKLLLVIFYMKFVVAKKLGQLQI